MKTLNGSSRSSNRFFFMRRLCSSSRRIAQAARAGARELRRRTARREIVLSGGVFQNVLLLNLLIAWVITRFNYWKIEHNEIIIHQGFLHEQERHPAAQNCVLNDVVDHERSQPHKRFVQQQQIRFGRQSARDDHALGLPTGELAECAVFPDRVFSDGHSAADYRPYWEEAFRRLVLQYDRPLVDIMRHRGALSYFHNHGPVMRYLEEQGRGYGLDPTLPRVPIVPAAVLFDLGLGAAGIRPDKAAGYAACPDADQYFAFANPGNRDLTQLDPVAALVDRCLHHRRHDGRISVFVDSHGLSLIHGPVASECLLHRIRP